MESKKPALYLHIGVHRTGTTSIQDYIHRNQQHFLDEGVLVAFGQGRPYRQAWFIRNRLKTSEAMGRDILTQIRNKGGTASKVIFSEEDICQTTEPKLFAGLSSKFDVKVVIFLRRQDQWLESWFQQNIKTQWDPELAHIGFSAFLRFAEENKFHWINYQSLVTNWSKVFGRENILLRVMERSRMPNGPVHEFLNVVGCDNLYSRDLDSHKNSSFSPQVSEFIRLLPLDGLQQKQIKAFILAAGGKISHSMDDRGVSILSPQQRQEIMGRYFEGNQWVAREYFGREGLFDDSLSQPHATWPELTSDESIALVNNVAGPMILQVAKEARKWQKKAKSRGRAPVAARPHYSKSYHFKMFFRLLFGQEE